MKRSRYEIIPKILDICVGGACKTKIVYQANLNFKTIDTYLNLLMKKDFITASMGRNISYKTTNNGMKLKEGLNQINDMLSKP
jgi:predicted transcriptional regulator